MGLFAHADVPTSTAMASIDHDRSGADRNTGGVASLVAPASDAPLSPPAAHHRVLLGTFVATSFLAASLLFLVEPMVTKMLLPLLGGTADVWNTAMVFFQAALLAGYSFAHVSLTWLGVRRQTIVQIALLLVPLAVLPIAVPAGWNPRGSTPIFWTLGALAVMVGLPFLALSTVGPTIQRWFAATDHPRANDPYFLYAASNIGSLLALLAYPVVIEPALSLSGQTAMWTGLYLLFVGCAAACALLTRRRPNRSAARDLASPDGAPLSQLLVDQIDHSDLEPADGRGARPARIGYGTAVRWVFLAAVPSALMLGVTRHLSTDVASMPLLWVVPLSLYLITFILAFGRAPLPLARHAGRVLKLLAIPLALTFFGLVGSLWLTFGLNLGVFFCAALVAHARLSSERPGPERLTTFYLLMSLGGMVGGVLAALVSPVIFNSVLEYPLAIVLALSILPASAFVRTPGTVPTGDGDERSPWPRTIGLAALVVALAGVSVAIRATGTQQALTISILVAAVVAAGAFVVARRPSGYAVTIGALLAVALLVPANPTIYQERTFFGVHRVYADENADGRHVLLNGTTVHGMEDYLGERAGEPTTYYHRTGPIGQYFESTRATEPPRTVGLIGLGTGALAAYGRPGDRFTYYEIDQAVVDVARDRRLFTFVSDSPAAIDFEVGDGRLVLEQEADRRFELLIVDAFSGDAIPVHLITEEALSLYEHHLAEHGVVAFHISNRYFDFAPVLGRLAAEQGLVAYLQNDPPTPEQDAEGKLEATWVVMARQPLDLPTVISDPRWAPLPVDPDAPLWTDSYSDLLHVFRGFG
jgi:SAM-dependent methyltransferase